MKRTARIRSSALFVSALALAALAVLPGIASAASYKHLLQLYKVEKQVDLERGVPVNTVANVSLSCNNGDYALDGMWRIDHVDQDSSFPGNVLTKVKVPVAAPNAADRSRYDFTLVNTAAGRVQAKVFITCLGRKTAPNGHDHAFKISSRKERTFSTGSVGAVGGFQSTDCPSGWIAVSPGYRFDSGFGRLVGSRPSFGGGEPPQLRNWAQAFWFDGGSSTWRTFSRCLKLTSSKSSGHRHSIVPSFVPGFSLSPTTPLGPGETKEITRSCADNAKGLVHAFDTTPTDAQFLHFFGMDPRIKSRVYRFHNSGGGSIGVWTGLLCLRDRTT